MTKGMWSGSELLPRLTVPIYYLGALAFDRRQIALLHC